MTSNTMKTDLSPARRRLVEKMQWVNHGSIEGLPVRNGEPVFDPPPRFVRRVQFGKENGPRLEAEKADFALKADVIELFTALDELGDCVITQLKIQDGLPKMMTFEELCA